LTQFDVITFLSTRKAKLQKLKVCLLNMGWVQYHLITIWRHPFLVHKKSYIKKRSIDWVRHFDTIWRHNSHHYWVHVGCSTGFCSTIQKWLCSTTGRCRFWEKNLFLFNITCPNLT
jgi:hypothetical protein